MTSSTTTPGSKIGRARRTLGQLWQVPAFLLGVLALLGVAASTPWRHTPQEREFEELVQSLRHGLDNEQPDGNTLVALAENAEIRLTEFPSRAAEVHFLIGSAYYRQAQQQSPAQALLLWPHAAEHLEQALGGVREADKAVLQYRLGHALYQQGKDLARAIDLMTPAVEKGSDQPLAAYQLLVKANLQLDPPAGDAALAASRRVLDLTPDREADAVAQARLQYGEMLLKKDLRADALKELERIGAKAPRAIRLKARQLQARACEGDGQWSRAIPLWQELLTEAPYVEGGRARIDHALGLCYLRLEPPNPEEAVRVWTEAVRLGGSDGQAAGLRLGELRLSFHAGKDAAQALDDWKQALANVNTPTDFKNPHFELKQVRALFDHALKHFNDIPDPQKTEELAALYRKIAPAGVAELKLAEAAEALAKQMQEKGKGTDSAADVQAQFRRAAEAYEQAAKVRPEEERPESLWRSVQCFLSGKESARAYAILLVLKEKETRMAEGWYTLGDLYRSQGQKDQAHRAYIKCSEYPNTPFKFRASYALALEAIEQKDMGHARDILNEILAGDQTIIDRPAHEKAIFKMASLLMQLKAYDEAKVYLNDAVLRYPENPEVPLTRVQLGECYRKLAEKEMAKVVELDKQITTSKDQEQRVQMEETRRHHRQTCLGWLNDALKTYQGLADDLNKKKPLDENEEKLLRRAKFRIGECRFDAGNIEAAMQIFQEIQLRHRRTPEGLSAGVYICNMVEVIPPSKLADQARELARESIRSLLDDLTVMPKDDEFFKASGPREEWLRWADTMRTKLFAPPKTNTPTVFP